jgi:hypothetical protein
LNELYGALRLYVNFFQPSMKFISKRRIDSRVCKIYDTAQTPHHRLIAGAALDEKRKEQLNRSFRDLTRWDDGIFGREISKG